MGERNWLISPQNIESIAQLDCIAYTSSTVSKLKNATFDRIWSNAAFSRRSIKDEMNFPKTTKYLKINLIERIKRYLAPPSPNTMIATQAIPTNIYINAVLLIYYVLDVIDL